MQKHVQVILAAERNTYFLLFRFNTGNVLKFWGNINAIFDKHKRLFWYIKYMSTHTVYNNLTVS